MGDFDPNNDQIWEWSSGAGEPPAVAIQTTYGLRARGMRLFPRIVQKNVAVTDPAHFHRKPVVTHWYPNYLAFTALPVTNIHLASEYWVQSSNILSGRITLTNQGVASQSLRLEWVAVLNPLADGESMTAVTDNRGVFLEGKSGGVFPVCLLSGAPTAAGSGPFPSLAADFDLAPGTKQTLVWSLASCAALDESLEQARIALNRCEDGQLARIELLNQAHLLEIETGNPDWDLALAASQRLAFGLLHPGRPGFSNATFVRNRRPDFGYSITGDGTDFPPPWSGQTALDAYFLNSLILPGGIDQAAGIFENFLSARSAEQPIDFCPGSAGQRSGRLYQPVLATTALQLYPYIEDPGRLKDWFSPLFLSAEQWFTQENDRDQDGIPEWGHPIQTGLEEIPTFSRWSTDENDLGVNITALETPALTAMLYREYESLETIAEKIEENTALAVITRRKKRLKAGLTEMWDTKTHRYQYRDFQTHTSPAGSAVLSFKAEGIFSSRRVFKIPQRMQLRLFCPEGVTRSVQIVIEGQTSDGEVREHFAPWCFSWSGGRGYATSNYVYTRIQKIEVRGLSKGDRGQIIAVDFTKDDITHLLPLWSGASDKLLQPQIMKRMVMNQFIRSFGIPISPGNAHAAGVNISWNHLIGEGLIRSGAYPAAALLTTNLMNAAAASFKQNGGFFHHYHAEKGTPQGERGYLNGFAPVGLFLQTIGVQILNAKSVILKGPHPFPWPVTVKYRGIMITRRSTETLIKFPNGKTISVLGQEPRRITIP